MATNLNGNSSRGDNPGEPLNYRLEPSFTMLGSTNDDFSGKCLAPENQTTSIDHGFSHLDRFNLRAPISYDAKTGHHSGDSFDTEVSKTITWDSAKGKQVAFQMLRKPSLDTIQKWYPEAMAHAALMLERLSFQHRVYKVECTFSPMEMVRLSFNYGPEFASMWKTAWENSRFEFLGVQLWKNSEPSFLQRGISWANGYNGVYSHRHFIFWKEECDDYKYSLDKPMPVNEETLGNLRYFAYKLSKKYLKPEDFGDEIDVLLETLPVSSSCYLEKKGTKKKEWESEFYDLYSIREEANLCGSQSQAPKKPGETRDITVPSPGVLRACKRLNRPLKEALKRVRDCPFGRNKEDCIKIMEKHDRMSNHYLRDFRKIGLTLPKAVIEAFLEGFFSDYPEFTTRIVEFFCKTKLLIDMGGYREWYPTTSGFHMGFFNEGLTWIQYAVHKMVMQEMTKKGKQILFAAFNDDSLISCRDYGRLDLYQNIDQRIWDELSCPLSYNKCGMAKNSFVFLEEIFKDKNRMAKDSLYALGIIGAKHAVNIVHAKDYVNSITQTLECATIGVKIALEDVCTHWGYEFYPEESEMPYLFGGWMTPKEEGLDASLHYYNGSKFQDRAYWAVTTAKRQNKTICYKKGWTFFSKFLDLSLWGEIPDTLDKLTGASLHFYDEATAKRTFSRLSMDWKGLKWFYLKLYKKRNRTFYAKNQPPVTEGWLLRHPNSVITTHVVDVDTNDKCWMLGEAPSIRHGKPQRLSLQTLINEGIIRSSVSRVRKLHPLIHETLIQGFTNSIPCVPLPDNKYVHESILYGQHKAYQQYFNRTGRIPVSRKATIHSEVFIISSETKIPWQIVHLLLKLKLRELIDPFKSAVAELNRSPERLEIPHSPEVATPPDLLVEVMADVPNGGDILLEMMKAADPEWVCSLPLTPPVQDVFDNWKGVLCNPQEEQALLERLNVAPLGLALRPLGSPASAKEVDGVQPSESDDDFGDAMANLFGED